MSYRAWAYIWIIILGAVAFSVASLLTFSTRPTQWLTFLLLTVLATWAQLYKVQAPKHVLFHATPIFLFAGVLLLDPLLFILLVAISHGVEWVKERWIKSEHLRAWYLQPFNIAKNSLAGMAAHLMYVAFDERISMLPRPSAALLVTIAALVYLVVNNLLLGQALVLARGVSWRASGVFNAENLMSELVLLLLGGIVALLWQLSPAFVPLAISPVLLIYRAMMVPKLKEEAQTDSKTGLLNARYLVKVLNDELARARRFERPFTVIMADLDHLRNINNIYGHFAGDVVLAGIAKIIRETLHDYDIAGRFGGEEFMLGFPEADALQAQVIAERVRMAIELSEFDVSTSPTPIKVTMSFGLACFPQDAVTLEDLIHEADAAVYQAKHQGRNQLVCAADVPHYTKVEYSISTRKQNTPKASATLPDYAPFMSVNGNEDHNRSINAPERECHNIATADDGEKNGPISAHYDSQRDASEPSQPAGARPMSRWAWGYIWTVLALGVGLSAFVYSTFTSSSVPWLAFAVLFVLATVAQLKKVDGPNHLLFHATPVFFFAGVLLLPPFLLLLLILGPHLLQWAKERWNKSPHLRDWYLQPFNVAMYLIAAFSAQWIYKIFIPDMPNSFTLSAIVMTMVAAATYIVVNNMILGYALLLARGISWQQSGVLKLETLLPEFIMVCLGVVVAYLWVTSTWLILPALLPLVLMYRALTIPMLQAENMQKLQRVNEELSAANSAIQRVNDELFLTLAKIFDARDPYVGGHAAQVAMYAVAIANELGLPTERIDIIRQSAYLHDIGKIAISETILHKPSKLTNDEFEIMKHHAAIGAEFLETSQGLRHLAPFVRHHHERWDGRGYPSGLLGEGIPLESRILNVCDSVEAMASDRPYHKGMSVDEIIAEVQRCSGTQFDPTIADAFVRIAERNGAHFVRNSAREVERSYANVQDASALNSALFFAKIYKQVA
jgi:diguanylate cyclase (GGDEF)-like protein/putative nucleotidyltransferase with HDIG domain